MVHFVIDVQSDFLGGDDGLHADIHITIGSDREIAGHSELIAGGKGNGAGVDGGSVSRNLHHLFLHLLVVHFVVEVQGDFLGGGRQFRILSDEDYFTRSSLRSLQNNVRRNIIPFFERSGDTLICGSPLPRIKVKALRCCDFRYLESLAALRIQLECCCGAGCKLAAGGYKLDRDILFQIIRLAVVIAVLGPNGIQSGILVDAFGLIRIDDTCGVLCIQARNEILFRLAEAKKNSLVSGKGNAIANRNRVVL